MINNTYNIGLNYLKQKVEMFSSVALPFKSLPVKIGVGSLSIVSMPYTFGSYLTKEALKTLSEVRGEEKEFYNQYCENSDVNANDFDCKLSSTILSVTKPFDLVEDWF